MAEFPDSSFFNLDTAGPDVNAAMMRWFETTKQLPGAMPAQRLTIENNAIAPQYADIVLDTEGQAAADDLEIIDPSNIHDGAIIYLRSTDNERKITVKHNPAQEYGIRLLNQQDKNLSSLIYMQLVRNGNKWLEMENDIGAMNVARNMFAGIIIEWECETIPTLDDGLPLGLELDGSVVDLAVYPRLERVWCGASKNATNPAWYKCDSGGTRNAGGNYIKLQDRRDYFPFGWPHGTGTEASAMLGGKAAGNTIPRYVGKDGASHLSIQLAGGRQELIPAPGFSALLAGTAEWAATADPGKALYSTTETINRHEIFPRHVHTMYLVLI